MIDVIDHGAVRELRLNHPPANAISPELMVALIRAIESAPQQGARALILSGAPGMFSAGLDVPVLLKLDKPAISAAWREFYTLLCMLASCPLPLAAAITGHGPAGGTVLALFCDYRVAADGDFKLGLNEVQVGLMLPPAIYAALQHVVGARQAERLAVAGLLMAPAEAMRVGLVDEVVAPDRVVERAREWCEQLLRLPPQAMACTRAKARSALTCLFERNFTHELDDVCERWWRDETQATLRGLVERLKKKS